MKLEALKLGPIPMQLLVTPWLLNGLRLNKLLSLKKDAPKERFFLPTAQGIIKKKDGSYDINHILKITSV